MPHGVHQERAYRLPRTAAERGPSRTGKYRRCCLSPQSLLEAVYTAVKKQGEGIGVSLPMQRESCSRIRAVPRPATPAMDTAPCHGSLRIILHTDHNDALRWRPRAARRDEAMPAGCAGKAMQARYHSYPASRVLPGCPPHHAGVAGTKTWQLLPADSRTVGMAAAGTAAL